MGLYGVTQIYVLSTHPAKRAEYHCDMHLAKMAPVYAGILEAAHGNRHGLTASRLMYHRWAMTEANFNWLARLIRAMLEEQNYRFGMHDEIVMGTFRSVIHEDDPLTPFHGLPRFIQSVEYKLPGEPIRAYREHYLQLREGECWTRRGPPGWWGAKAFQQALSY